MFQDGVQEVQQLDMQASLDPNSIQHLDARPLIVAPVEIAQSLETLVPDSTSSYSGEDGSHVTWNIDKWIQSLRKQVDKSNPAIV